MAHQWQLQEAKARFSQLVDEAVAGEAQIVTRHGEPVVAVIPMSEYERLRTQGQSLWEAIRPKSPVTEDDFLVTRDQTPITPVSLD